MMTRVASCVLRVASEEPSASTRNSQLATRNCFPGFTFIEVLFAVILLGIGFIMIAGVFPVAIQQTAAVSDETQGTAIARDAIKKIQMVADNEVTGATPPPGSTNSLFQPTSGAVMGFSYALTQALGADAFFTADHRFGWVGFYRRDSVTNPFAQIFIIALENPNFANYTTPYYWNFASGTPTLTQISGASLTQQLVPPWASVPPPIPPNTYNALPPGTFNSISPQASSSAPIYTALQAPVAATNYYSSSGAATEAILYYDPNSGNSTVTFFGSSSSVPSTPPNAVTGAFLLVANDNLPGTYAGFLNGRFFRLGTQQSAPPAAVAASSNYSTNPGQTFALQPGFDLLSDLYNLSLLPTNPAPLEPWGGGGSGGSGVTFFLIGRAPMLNPGTYSGDFTGPFTGPNQDIGVASGFIRVNTANN